MTSLNAPAGRAAVGFGQDEIHHDKAVGKLVTSGGRRSLAFQHGPCRVCGHSAAFDASKMRADIAGEILARRGLCMSGGDVHLIYVYHLHH